MQASSNQEVDESLIRRTFLKHLGVGTLFSGLMFLRATSHTPEASIGASYYLYYRTNLSNWHDGHLRMPLLGEYRSDDSQIMRTHLEWAQEFGVDVFYVSWVGYDRDPDVIYFDRNLQQLMNHAALFETERQVAILFESADRFNREPDGTIHFDRPDNVERLLTDFEYLAEQYFEHPQFLRVDGRPVVYLYETLAFRGDVAGTFQQLRQHLNAHAGLELFLISSDAHPLADPEDQRNAQQARQFDGISLWAAGYMVSGDYGGPYEDYLRRGNERWANFSQQNNREFMPSVIPGFDQRWVSWGNHTSVPLERSPERFRERLEIVKPFLTGRRLLRIDTWNDFFENTVIEPTQEEGFAYLEELRQFRARVMGG